MTTGRVRGRKGAARATPFLPASPTHIHESALTRRPLYVSPFLSSMSMGWPLAVFSRESGNIAPPGSREIGERLSSPDPRPVPLGSEEAAPKSSSMEEGRERPRQGPSAMALMEKVTSTARASEAILSSILQTQQGSDDSEDDEGADLEVDEA